MIDLHQTNQHNVDNHQQHFYLFDEQLLRINSKRGAHD